MFLYLLLNLRFEVLDELLVVLLVVKEALNGGAELAGEQLVKLDLHIPNLQKIF